MKSGRILNMRYTIISKSDLSTLKNMCNNYDNITDENQNLKTEIEIEREPLIYLQSLLDTQNSVIFSIKKDKNNYTSYVCVQGALKPEMHLQTESIIFNGPLIIFVISSFIIQQVSPTIYSNLPYLNASFRNGNITIEDLHCDIKGDMFENKGYGTMMVDTLVQIASKCNSSSITGQLSSVDACTPEKKEKRNSFYKKRGFTLLFDDDAQENGQIKKVINNSSSETL